MPTMLLEAAAPPGPDTLNLRASGAGAVDIVAAPGEGKRPTFTITGYTGAVMHVAGYFTPVIVDLAGLKAASQRIPALHGHDHDRVVGQTDAVTIDASGVTLSGTFTGENAHTVEVVSQAKNGFRWQASIGADVVRREHLESGKKAMVNGRECTGPMMIAREAVLKEISFVAIGADNQTAASVAASNPSASHQGAPTMQFEQWLQAKGFDPAALSDEQKTSLKALYDAETRPAPAPEPRPAPAPEVKATQTLDEIFAAHRAEQRRVDEITRITAEAVRDRPLLADELEQMAKAAIEAQRTPAEYELLVLRATRFTGGPAIHAPDRKAGAKVIEAAVCLSGGLADPEKHFDERTLSAASDRFRHGLGLVELLLLAAREHGHSGVSPRDVHGLLEAAFGRGIQAGGFSTLSLPGILSNVANKFVTTGFTAVESTWRQIASRRTVTDFKTITSYSLTGALEYEEVGPSGELKHGTLSELEYTNRAKTYGRILSVTRADIINDDLGALTQVPMKLGRGAGLKVNDVFWTAFLAGVGSFWAAGNNNLKTGAGSVLASAGLKDASDAFKKQTDPDGKPLGLMPKILLVPTELEITADELMTSTQVNTGGSSSTDRVPNRNVWSGKFRAASSTYLSNSSYTGYSTTAWFLLADPADLSTIEIAFLNGRERPVVESADADFDTLGIKMRGYHDFGVALQEKRASVRSAGA